MTWHLGLTFCGALLTAACSPTLEIWLFNGSGVELELLLRGQTHCVLPSQQRCVFDFDDRFVLRLGAEQREYVFPNGLPYETSRDWVEVVSFARRRIGMQVEPDHSIWILPATAHDASPTHYGQRPGFPLRPVPRAAPNTTP